MAVMVVGAVLELGSALGSALGAMLGAALELGDPLNATLGATLGTALELGDAHFVWSASSSSPLSGKNSSLSPRRRISYLVVLYKLE
jgi:hypothetical protein